MARIRTIKPEFYCSETLARLSREARYLFVATWVFADDHGVFIDSARRLLGEVYPFDDDVSESMVKAWIDQLEEADLIRRFHHNNKHLILIRGWREHQRIDKPGKNTLAPREIVEGVAQPSRVSREGCASVSRNSDGGTMDLGSRNKDLGSYYSPERCERSEPEDSAQENDNSEFETAEPDTSPAVVTIPLVDGTEHAVTKMDVDAWQMAYPAVDVAQRLQRIASWNVNNPKRRKTRNGIRRHIDSWLAKEQDSGGGGGASVQQSDYLHRAREPARFELPDGHVTVFYPNESGFFREHSHANPDDRSTWEHILNLELVSEDEILAQFADAAAGIDPHERARRATMRRQERGGDAA